MNLEASDLELAARAFRAACDRAEKARRALDDAEAAYSAAKREQDDFRRALLTIAHEEGT